MLENISFKNILSKSFSDLKRNWKMIGLVAIYFLVFSLVSELLKSSASFLAASSVWGKPLVSFLIGVCDIFIYCLTVGVGCSIALKLVDSNIAFTHRQFIESVKKGFSKVFKYMGIQAMILLYCIPSLLLAVGGISCVANNPDGYLLFTLGVLMLIGAFLSFYYLLISYAFSNFIILDKNTGVFKSLKSSKELVKKDFLKSIAIFFGFGLISVLNIAAFVFLTVAPLSLGMSFIPFSGEVWFAVVAVIIAIAFVVLVIVEVLLLLGVTNFYKQMQHKHGSSFEQAGPSL